MKWGVNTCKDPIDPNSLYMRNMYNEFFWGPFKDESALISAIAVLDAAVPFWDNDPFCIIYGANPLPKDYVFGFKSAGDEMVRRVGESRKRSQP